MKIEIRKYIASLLIRLTMWLLPEGKFKKAYYSFLLSHLWSL